MAETQNLIKQRRRRVNTIFIDQSEMLKLKQKSQQDLTIDKKATNGFNTERVRPIKNFDSQPLNISPLIEESKDEGKDGKKRKRVQFNFDET